MKKIIGIITVCFLIASTSLTFGQKKVKQPKYLENKVFVIGMNESGKKDVPDE